MRIYAFKRKKTSRKRCVNNHGNLYLFCFTYAYMLITVHPPDFAGDENIDFEFSNACLLWHPFYFSMLIKVTQHALRPHNLIFLLSFVLLLSPKQ